MKQTLLIPIERINQVLDYIPSTGQFWWKETLSCRAVAGKPAGNDTGRRDVRISVDGKLYQAHRLAWAIMTGEQPPPLIDHIDLDSRNNAWGNLRAADVSTNGANRRAASHSKSGSKGVIYLPAKTTRTVGGGPPKPWRACVVKNQITVFSKFFSTREEAEAAYAAAAKEHFGEFARTA